MTYQKFRENYSTSRKWIFGLKIVEIIGEDDISNLDPETILIITRLLNKRNCIISEMKYSKPLYLQEHKNDNKEILIEPDPILRKKSTEVKEVDREIKTLMDDMLETMYDAPGIGLAAIQIGIAKRVISYRLIKRSKKSLFF